MKFSKTNDHFVQDRIFLNFLNKFGSVK